MDEQAFLHDVSVRTNLNIELLKDLYKNEKLWNLIQKGKTIDAVLLVRSTAPKVGLTEAKRVVEAFTAVK
jgi:ribosomal protein L7/L12